MSKVAAEIKDKLRAKAKEHYQRLVKLSNFARLSPMKVGWVAAEMKRNNEFVIMGFQDENSCREKLKIGRSTWYRYIRIAEGFKKISEQRFCGLVAENAELALKLGEEERIQDKWLKRMAEMKEEDFEKLINKRRAESEGVPEEDVRVIFKISMANSQRDVIKACMEKFKKAHELKADDDARALELMAAEASNGGNILAAIMKTLPNMKATWEFLKDKKEEHTDLNLLHKAVGDHIMEMAKAAGIKV